MPTEMPEWLLRLRRTEVTRRVNNDPRSIAGTTFGIDRDTAVREVVGGGQADFDEPWGELSADDRVLLYAYYNQLGHLEELIEAFRTVFSSGPPDAEPIVMDLGCGPFTGGLAVSGVLGRDCGFDYIGVDRSQSMRRFGEHLACTAERLDETARIDRHWFSGVSEVEWDRAPGWRPVFVIVSYLLASPTLNAVTLAAELGALLDRLGRGPVTVLYTNSPRTEANRSFPPFRDALLAADFRLFADDTGTIEIDRWGGPKKRDLRYALFFRSEQRVLSLGGN